MRIDALIVCVGYADMLAYTLPQTLRTFASVTVVTRPDDDETQAMLAGSDVRVVVTDAFDQPGQLHLAGPADHRPFNKGAAINAGLAEMPDKDWVCIIDADIVMPSDFATALERVHLHKDRLYGCQRCDIRDTLELEEFLVDPTKANDLPRVRSRPGVGYLQLFNIHSNYIKPPIYPDQFAHAGGCDTVFLRKFGTPRAIPCTVGHLAHGDHRGNWFGRTSPTWGVA